MHTHIAADIWFSFPNCTSAGHFGSGEAEEFRANPPSLLHHFVQNTSNTGSQMHEAPLHHWYTDLRFEIVTFSHAKIPLVILDKYSACTAIHVTQQSSVD